MRLHGWTLKCAVTFDLSLERMISMRVASAQTLETREDVTPSECCRETCHTSGVALSFVAAPQHDANKKYRPPAVSRATVGVLCTLSCGKLFDAGNELEAMSWCNVSELWS